MENHQPKDMIRYLFKLKIISIFINFLLYFHYILLTFPS